MIDPLNDAYKDNLDEPETLADLVGESGTEISEAESSEAAVDGAGTESAEPVAKAEPEAKPKKKVAAVVSTPKPEPSILDTIMDNLLWIGGGLLALLVGVWAFLRRRSGAEEEDDSLEPQFDSSPLMPADTDGWTR